jgi:ABC-type multidrug transport system ATPase subunit
MEVQDSETERVERGITVHVRGASKTYESWGRIAQALRNVDFDAEAGEVVAIIGTNGSGKSTLLKSIGGLIQLDAGRLEIGGVDISSISKGSMAKLRGMLHQAPLKSLCPNFSIEEMLRLYLDGFESQSQDSLRSRLAEAEVPSRGRVRELSGGQQQLLALELVLARRPRLILLDEPTASLDTRHATRILERIAEAGQNGITVVLVSHNLEQGLEISQRLVFLHEGRCMRTWRGGEINNLSLSELRRLFYEISGMPLNNIVVERKPQGNWR